MGNRVINYVGHQSGIIDDMYSAPAEAGTSVRRAGVAHVGDDTVDQQQDKIIDDLITQVAELFAKNAELTDRVRRLELK